MLISLQQFNKVMRLSYRLLGISITTTVLSIFSLPGLTQGFEHFRALNHEVAQSGNFLLETQGVLEENDETLSDGSLYDIHHFEGRAGQTLLIRLESNEFNPYLILIDATGKKIAENDDSSPPNTNAQLTVRLPANGSYRIIANALLNSGRGNYRLTIAEANAREAEWIEADRLLQLGIQYFQASQFDTAQQTWAQALAIFRRIGDRQKEASLLNNLGLVYGYSGQFQRAIDFHQQSFAIAQETGDRKGEANALGNLGIAFYSLGEYERAIDFHQQSLAIKREISDSQGEANSLGNLGLAYHSLGQYAIAVEFHQQALAIDREMGNRRSEADSLGNIGVVYLALGQHERAIELQQQALSLDRETGNRKGEADSLGNLANIYYVLGQYEIAIDMHQQALAIDREIGNRQGEGKSIGNLCAAYLGLGEYGQAIDLCQQASAIAREIGDLQEVAGTLGNLGLAYFSLQEYEQAIDLYQQALTIARRINNPQMAAFFLNNQGLTLIDLNRFAQAELVLTQSLTVLESLRVGLLDNQLIAIADTQARTYANLKIALTAQTKTPEALIIAERGRARAFALQLTSHLTDAAEEVAVEMPTISEIQQIARVTNSTLVTYSLIFDEALYIWVISPSGNVDFRSVEFDRADDSGFAANPIAEMDGPIYRGATESSELGELVADLRGSVAVEFTGVSQSEQLHELHKVLIDPIADLLPSDPEEQVVFVPQGSLFLVPFAALQDEAGTSLIEKHTILTAPSIQVFGLAHEAAASRPAPSASDHPLVVGNPVMPTVWAPTESGEFVETQLSRLPGAGAEAAAISRALNVPVLTGDRATEAQIKQQLPTASLIHLATHGLLNYGDPQAYGLLDVPGAIALAPGNGEDGLLTAAEILAMDLQADLAVLSACDTGRGRITGDGVVGLSRSLITAGVPSVVVSLWAVSDNSTAALMAEFYRQLAAGQTKAQALRQAMLITKDQYADPRQWAAFTLIGAAN